MVVGAHHLTPAEVARTIEQATGVFLDLSRRLPAPAPSPFQRSRAAHLPSDLELSVLMDIAEEVAGSLPWARFTDCATVTAGVAPDAPAADACAAGFAADVLPVLWKREVPADEREAVVGPLWAAASSQLTPFATSLLTVALLDAEFLYRLETVPGASDDPSGAPSTAQQPAAPGTLTDDAIARRLAGFLTGASPDAALRAAAASGALRDPDVRAVHARRLLAEGNAHEHVATFHREWLGILPFTSLAEVAEQRAFTLFDAMLYRVLFEQQRPWTDLWTTTEFLVSPFSADVYGVQTELPDSGAWIDFAPLDSRRAGLLASIAWAPGRKNRGNPSPTRRGKLIMERLLCTPVGAPPPEVSTDTLPALVPGGCNRDQYLALRANPDCASCHTAMDEVGFGLEMLRNGGHFSDYDAADLFDNRPDTSCPIDGRGHLPDGTPFSGPAELGRLLVSTGAAAHCVVPHYVAFLYGEPVATLDAAYLGRLREAFADSNHDLPTLVEAVVRDPAFLQPLPAAEDPDGT